MPMTHHVLTFPSVVEVMNAHHLQRNIKTFFKEKGHIYNHFREVYKNENENGQPQVKHNENMWNY